MWGWVSQWFSRWLTWGRAGWRLAVCMPSEAWRGTNFSWSAGTMHGGSAGTGALLTTPWRWRRRRGRAGGDNNHKESEIHLSGSWQCNWSILLIANLFMISKPFSRLASDLPQSSRRSQKALDLLEIKKKPMMMMLIMLNIPLQPGVVVRWNLLLTNNCPRQNIVKWSKPFVKQLCCTFLLASMA